MNTDPILAACARAAIAHGGDVQAMIDSAPNSARENLARFKPLIQAGSQMILTCAIVSPESLPDAIKCLISPEEYADLLSGIAIAGIAFLVRTKYGGDIARFLAAFPDDMLEIKKKYASMRHRLDWVLKCLNEGQAPNKRDLLFAGMADDAGKTPLN